MLLMIVAAIGGALLLVGYLMTIAYAFSDGIKWGLGVVLIPFFAFYYIYRFWKKAAYPGKLLIIGSLLDVPIVFAFIFILLRDVT
jgi:hypothetical protein